MGMTIGQAVITWVAFTAVAVFLAVGAYYCLLRSRNRRATRKGLQAAQARWDTTTHWARLDIEIEGGDYNTAFKAEMQRTYRRIPDSINAGVQS